MDVPPDNGDMFHPLLNSGIRINDDSIQSLVLPSPAVPQYPESPMVIKIKIVNAIFIFGND